MSDEFADLDATAQAEWVRTGKASPVELVEAAIERTTRLDRSEERRVGKECRSRWSPYH